MGNMLNVVKSTTPTGNRHHRTNSAMSKKGGEKEEDQRGRASAEKYICKVKTSRGCPETSFCTLFLIL